MSSEREGSTKHRDATGSAVFYDASGMVIATEGLSVTFPWEIRHSAKFEGRYYFFNLETKKSCWSLRPDQIGIVDDLADKAEAKEGSLPHTGQTSLFPPIRDQAKQHAEGGLAEMKNSKSMMSIANLAPSKCAWAKAEEPSSPNETHGKGAKEAAAGDTFSPLVGFGTKQDYKLSSRSTNSLCGMLGSEKGAGINGAGLRGGSGMDDGGVLLHSKTGRLDMRTSNQAPGLPFSPSSGSLSGVVSTHDLTGMLALNLGPDGEGANNGHTQTTSAPIRVLEGLGQGGYAVVLKCQHEETGQEYALKVVSKAKAPRRRDRERLRFELKAMTELVPSLFLQRCHMAFESKTDLFFVLDLVNGGDLFYHLVQKITLHGWGFPEDEARVLLSEVVCGLEHLHRHGMIHRDVKVENIMLDCKGHVKLIDFGLACELKGFDERVSPTGSLIYMAPEMIRDHRGGRHTDWWALGVLSYELMTGRTPWSSLTDKKVIRKEIQTLNVAPPRRLSPPAGQLLCSLLRQDFNRRLGTASDDELRKCSFFKAIDWEATNSQRAEPAFVPPPQCTHERDRDAALQTYLAKQWESPGGGRSSGGDEGRSSAGSGGAAAGPEWHLGLQKVTEHPKYHQKGYHRRNTSELQDEGDFF